MKRTKLLAICWLLSGALVPVAAVMVILGCCDLPFHALVHRAMPLCDMAATALAHHGDNHDAPAAPAPSRPDAKPTMDRGWRAPERAATNAPLVLAATLPPPLAAGHSLRSQPIGAFRCDDDVGTRLAFVATLRL